jgi:hypothetical protein
MLLCLDRCGPLNRGDEIGGSQPQWTEEVESVRLEDNDSRFWWRTVGISADSDATRLDLAVGMVGSGCCLGTRSRISGV